MNKDQIIVMWIGIAILVVFSYTAGDDYGNSQRVGKLIGVLSIYMIIVSLTIGIIFQIGYLNRKKINK